MASGISDVIQQLRRAEIRREVTRLTDGQLLASYINHREEAPLATLIRRHGSMVWNVCRRVLSNYHDAENAFQTTFLVLVRKADSIDPPELLANWLYGVAYQTARKTRATTVKRSVREKQGIDMAEPLVFAHDPWNEVQPLLDKALNKLPDKYRIAIVLCYLEGKTRKEAARQLGVPEGTLAARLARGRALLAKRLVRHGVTLTGSVLATLLTQYAVSAAPPASLVSSTIKTAMNASAGHAVAGVTAAQFVASTERMLKTVLLTKLHIATAAVLLIVALGFGFYAAMPVAGSQQMPSMQTKVLRSVVQQAVQNWKARNVLQGHADAVQCLAFGPNNVLISGGKEGHVRVWDADAGKEFLTFQNMGEGVTGITYAADASWVAFRLENSIGLSFDKCIKEGKPITIGPGVGIGMVPMALAPDGMTYAWREENSNTVVVLDLDLTQKVVGGSKTISNCKGHTDKPLCAAFSHGATDPSEMILATGSADKTARIWDGFTGSEKFVLKGHADAVVVVEFSPDGKTLATGSNDGAVKIWDVLTGKEVLALKGHEGVSCFSFSPDGKLLASGGGDHLVKLWNAATGQQQAALKGHTDAIATVRFNRDGSLLASSGADKTVRVWQTQR